MDCVADHVGGALPAFWASGHGIDLCLPCQYNPEAASTTPPKFNLRHYRQFSLSATNLFDMFC